MARLFTTGAEENNITDGVIWELHSGNDPTISTTNPRSGTYRIDTNAANGNSSKRFGLASAVTSGTYYTRMGWLSSTATPSATSAILTFSNNTATAVISIQVLTTGAIRILNNVTTTTADSTFTISANTWYRIEVEYVISDTVGSVTVRIYNPSGTLQETVSITNEDTLNTNFQYFLFGKTASTAVFSYDDIAINDTSGSFQNSWAGDGKVYLINPTSDVSVTWEDETAGAGTFANIADIPGAVDDATSYNHENVTLNSVDQYGLADLGAEIGASDTIVLLHVMARVGSDGTTARSLRLKLWDESSTLTDGPTVAANVSGWRRINENEGLVYNASGKTKANIDGFTVGYENITDLATRDRRVTALWANVEWIEATGGPTVTWVGYIG